MIQKKHRILVADDDRISRIIMTTNLEAAGHSVRGEADGASALAALGQEFFDLVVLDLFMPDMDGDQVLEQIRANEALHALPVIIVSGDGDSENTRRCSSLGACGLLTKPVDPQELRRKIDECLPPE